MKDYVYTPFFKDYGPLNLYLIHRYIQAMDNMLNDESFKIHKIYHVTSTDSLVKTNAAFLMGCYMVFLIR